MDRWDVNDGPGAVLCVWKAFQRLLMPMHSSLSRHFSSDEEEVNLPCLSLLFTHIHSFRVVMFNSGYQDNRWMPSMLIDVWESLRGEYLKGSESDANYFVLSTFCSSLFCSIGTSNEWKHTSRFNRKDLSTAEQGGMMRYYDAEFDIQSIVPAWELPQKILCYREAFKPFTDCQRNMLITNKERSLHSNNPARETWTSNDIINFSLNGSNYYNAYFQALWCLQEHVTVQQKSAQESLKRENPVFHWVFAPMRDN